VKLFGHAKYDPKNTVPFSDWNKCSLCEEHRVKFILR
jgi:hypothetical protein